MTLIFVLVLHSDEESSFLTSVALGLKTTYKDIDKADQVVLLGLNQKKSPQLYF